MCQADRPLPPSMRTGRTFDVRKQYEKEYYYPMSTRPKRMLERQADMNNSSHSSQTNTGSASFHDISLSSSASELNSSIQSVHSSSQGDAEQSSFYSSSSSSSNRPAATSSPTPQKMTEAERKASPQTHGLQPITNQSQLP